MSVGNTTADAICTGIDVFTQDTDCARAFEDLGDLITYAGNGDYPRGLREVLQMLIDAADGAADVHSGDRHADVHERLVAFSAAIKAAWDQVKA